MTRSSPTSPAGRACRPPCPGRPAAAEVRRWCARFRSAPPWTGSCSCRIEHATSRNQFGRPLVEIPGHTEPDRRRRRRSRPRARSDRGGTDRGGHQRLVGAQPRIPCRRGTFVHRTRRPRSWCATPIRCTARSVPLASIGCTSSADRHWRGVRSSGRSGTGTTRSPARRCRPVPAGLWSLITG